MTQNNLKPKKVLSFSSILKSIWPIQKWTKKMSKNENPKILSEKKSETFLKILIVSIMLSIVFFIVFFVTINFFKNF